MTAILIIGTLCSVLLGCAFVMILEQFPSRSAPFERGNRRDRTRSLRTSSRRTR
jgi:hypothetical protein